MGEESVEIDALFFPVRDELLLGGEGAALGGEGFEEAFGVEVDALLVGGDDDFGEAGAFGGVEEFAVWRSGLSFHFDLGDFEVFFGEVVLEGAHAGERGIGEGAFDGEIATGGNGAPKGDEGSTRPDVGEALVATTGGASEHVILEGDPRRLGVSGDDSSDGADGAWVEGDLVTVAMEVEAVRAGAVVVPEVAPEPLIRGGAILEAGGVGDEGAGDALEVGVEQRLMPSGEFNIDAAGGEQGIAAAFDDDVVARLVEAGLELVVGPKNLQSGGSGDGLLNGCGGEREVGMMMEGLGRVFVRVFVRVALVGGVAGLRFFERDEGKAD